MFGLDIDHHLMHGGALAYIVYNSAAMNCQIRHQRLHHHLQLNSKCVLRAALLHFVTIYPMHLLLATLFY